MAEDKTQETPQTTGDAMLVATDLLKPPKARTGLKVLPRTIAWDHLFVVLACAVIGLIIGMVVFSGLQARLTCVALGAAFGYMLPSLSPLEGESILMWFGLQAKDATAKRVNINGRKAKMYVGTYPLKRTALGSTRLLPSAGSVKAQQYDERGYPELQTDKSSASKLEEQRKLRTKRQSKGLKASTTLAGAPQKKRMRITPRNEVKAMASPRIPKAKTTSVKDVVKGSQPKKRKRKSARM